MLNLKLHNGCFGICRLPAGAGLPTWIFSGGGFVSITRTQDEFSVVCTEDAIPPATICERGWSMFQIAGPLDFALTGILASIADPLAAAKVSIFAVSTYDTDYVLVKEQNLETAIRALTAAGHSITRQ